LPTAPVDGDLNGLRFGTPEIVRRGMQAKDMPHLAKLIARALKSDDPQRLAGEVTAFRHGFRGLHFIRA
jgi:glycine hydroxymethyltransferase